MVVSVRGLNQSESERERERDSERDEAVVRVAMGALNNNPTGVRGSKGVSAHQLSNGLFVSGQPDRGRDKGTIMSVPQMPYTGGDIKKSGELGKMLNIPVESNASAKSGGRRSGGLLTGSSSQRSSNPGGASSSHSGPLSGNGTGRNAFSASGPFKLIRRACTLGSREICWHVLGSIFSGCYSSTAAQS